MTGSEYRPRTMAALNHLLARHRVYYRSQDHLDKLLERVQRGTVRFDSEPGNRLILLRNVVCVRVFAVLNRGRVELKSNSEEDGKAAIEFLARPTDDFKKKSVGALQRNVNLTPNLYSIAGPLSWAEERESRTFKGMKVITFFEEFHALTNGQICVEWLTEDTHFSWRCI